MKRKRILQALTNFYNKVYKPLSYYAIDNMEFGRVEKVILIYFGLKRNESLKLVKRTHITKEVANILGRQDDNNFAIVLNNALRRLVVDKKVLYRRYSRVGINNKGLKVASSILEEIKKKSNKKITSWNDILEAM